MQKLLTAEEAALLLKIKREAVWRYARMQIIPVVRVGRQYRFDEAELIRWKENGGRGICNREAPYQ